MSHIILKLARNYFLDYCFIENRFWVRLICLKQANWIYYLPFSTFLLINPPNTNHTFPPCIVMLKRRSLTFVLGLNISRQKHLKLCNRKFGIYKIIIRTCNAFKSVLCGSVGWLYELWKFILIGICTRTTCDAIIPQWWSGYHTRRVIERSRVQIPTEGMDFLNNCMIVLLIRTT